MKEMSNSPWWTTREEVTSSTHEHLLASTILAQLTPPPPTTQKPGKGRGGCIPQVLSHSTHMHCGFFMHTNRSVLGTLGNALKMKLKLTAGKEAWEMKGLYAKGYTQLQT